MITEETYIVIGACGYLGNNIVRHLVEQEKKVRCLVMDNEDITPLNGLPIEIFKGNILRQESLLPLFNRNSPLSVIHAAGIVSTVTTMDKHIWDVNVLGTQNVADLCLEYGAKMVYIGSVDAIPPQQDYSVAITEPDVFTPQTQNTIYGQTKAVASNIVLDRVKKGLKANIVMPSAVFGPYDYKGGAVYSLISKYAKRNAFPLVKGGYDFVDVRDVAAASVQALKLETYGECYVLSNCLTPFSQIVNLMRNSLGYSPINTFLPNWLVYFAGDLVEFFSKIVRKPPLFTSYLIKLANSGKYYDNTKARLKLGFKPRSVDSTVLDSLAFMQDNGFITVNTGAFGNKKECKK